MGNEVKEFPLEQEYGKPTGVTPRDVARLREWLPTQPHLPGEHITDMDLILAYHCSNRSTEVAKQVLDLHLTLKTLFSTFFKERHFDKRIETIMTDFLVTKLAAPSPEGYVCFYGRALNLDPKKLILGDLIRAIFMVLDVCQHTEGTWPGATVVCDMAGVTLAHMAAMDMTLVQQYLYFCQEALLLQLKSIHVINTTPFVDKMFTLVKPFLKKELLDILHIHVAGSRMLDKYYSMDNLPKEAGGTIKSFAEYRDETIIKVKNGEEYYIKENKKRVDESKRPGKPKTFSDIFGGVVGSFKKLEID